MDPFTSLAVGFCLGSLVVGISLLALVGKTKVDNLRAYKVIEMTNKRLRKVDKERAEILSNLIETNSENEFLKTEVERLRNEKLDAWGIPGGLS